MTNAETLASESESFEKARNEVIAEIAERLIAEGLTDERVSEDITRHSATEIVDTVINAFLEQNLLIPPSS